MTRIYEYTVHYTTPNDDNRTITLVGCSKSHAIEEASYEIDEEWTAITKAVRGEFLYTE